MTLEVRSMLPLHHLLGCCCCCDINKATQNSGQPPTSSRCPQKGTGQAPNRRRRRRRRRKEEEKRLAVSNRASAERPPEIPLSGLDLPVSACGRDSLFGQAGREPCFFFLLPLVGRQERDSIPWLATQQQQPTYYYYAYHHPCRRCTQLSAFLDILHILLGKISYRVRARVRRTLRVQLLSSFGCGYLDSFLLLGTLLLYKFS